MHVKVDSGFGRNGFTPATFDAALAKLVPLAKEGVCCILSASGATWRWPTLRTFLNSWHPPTGRSRISSDFTRRMEQAGIAPEIRHLANTAATLSRPEIHFELTRPGYRPVWL